MKILVKLWVIFKGAAVPRLGKMVDRHTIRFLSNLPCDKLYKEYTSKFKQTLVRLFANQKSLNN